MNVASSASEVSVSRSPTGVFNKESARLQAYALLMLVDVTVLVASFLIASEVYWGSVKYAQIAGLRSPHGALIATILAPLYLAVALLNRVYSTDSLRSLRIALVRSVQSLLTAAAAILFIAYLLKAGEQFSRAVFAMGFMATLIALPLARLLTSGTIRRSLGGNPLMVVVIRDGLAYAPVEGEIAFTPEELSFDPATNDPFAFHAFANAVAHADRVIIACGPARYPAWSAVLKSMAIDGEIITDEHDPIGIIGVGKHGERRTLVVASGPLDLRNRVVKRVLDLVVASTALIVMSPLLLVIACLIKLGSRGPVLFKQNRIGRDNKIFRMLKFRSMYTETTDHNAAQLTSRNDSRVTRIGEIIRKTSIDELPQLINVLLGDMSIVGPRPHPLSAKAADLLYWDADPRYRQRHAIKPGLTGLAQIRGFRGSTERVEDLTNRLEADLEYSLQWTLARDIQIIVQTLFVLKHDNAF